MALKINSLNEIFIIFCNVIYNNYPYMIHHINLMIFHTKVLIEFHKKMKFMKFI